MTDPRRLLMIDLSGPTLTPDERALLSGTPLGGVCLFSRNIRDRFQLGEYVLELRSLAGDDFIVAVDQEGGSVVRALDLPYPPSAMALGAADDTDLTRDVAAATGRGLRSVGINVDFAPVADVNHNPHNPVIGERAFGSDPAHVARHVAAFVEGVQREGVAATAKHFPGHGDVSQDSHLTLPTLNVTAERLERVELVPFRAAIDAGVAALMSFHGLLPALDPDRPATLSRAIMHDLVRDRLGFGGVMFSDALNMRAIRDQYTMAEAATLALQAGVDMPVHVGTLAETTATLAGLVRAEQEGRFDPAQLAAAGERLEHLTYTYPAHSPRPDTAWQESDDDLLGRAATRGTVLVGDLPTLPDGGHLTLVTLGETSTGGAGDVGPKTIASEVVGSLAAALRARGYRVDIVNIRTADIQHENDRADHLAPFRHSDATLLVSVARIRLDPSRTAFVHDLARVAPCFIHLALWNPYQLIDLPKPALVTFGFRPASLRAAVTILCGDASPGGRLPFELANTSL
ncbi:MAG: beta-N-acetylhexosaminidase [Trueperaceae bacterium]|nr:beta-N-acetylhexosaminidase [Trueperaceae bacterium]